MSYEQACIMLNIKDRKEPRLEGMSGSVKLKGYQVVGIATLLMMSKFRWIRAAILADATGLGKTYEFIGYLLAVSIRSQHLMR
jgi:hypothetical protein